MIMSESHRRATSKCEDKLMCAYMYVILCYLFFMLYIYIDTKRSEEAEASDSQDSLIPIYFLLDTEKPLKDELGDTV